MANLDRLIEEITINGTPAKKIKLLPGLDEPEFRKYRSLVEKCARCGETVIRTDTLGQTDGTLIEYERTLRRALWDEGVDWLGPPHDCRQ